MSSVPSVKKVRFATFIDIRYYDSEEAIFASAEEEDEEEDEEVFYDSLEDQKSEDAEEEDKKEEEEVVVAFEAEIESVPSAPSLAVARAPKRPLEADDEEATPKHESKRLHLDEACSLLAVGAPFAVYQDDPLPAVPAVGENAAPRQRNDENDVSGPRAPVPPSAPSPGLRVRRPLGLKFTSSR